MTTHEQIAGKEPAAPKPLKTAKNWNQWLDRWKQAEYAKDKLALLHSVATFPCHFSAKAMSTGDMQKEKAVFDLERILFLLDVADTHIDHYGYFPSTHLSCMSEALLCEEVAAKAFKVLCELVFKEGSEDGYSSSTWPNDTLRAPSFAERILDFFQPGESIMIKNLWWPDQRHQERLAKGFLLAYCGWVRKRHIYNCRERYIGIKIKAVPILHRLRRTDIMIGDHEIYDEELEMLERLVLDEKKSKALIEGSTSSPYMVAGTIEEAAFMGSTEAMTCLILRNNRAIEEKYNSLVQDEYRKQAKKKGGG